MTDTSRPWLRDTALLFFAIGLFFCLGLEARPYMAPSEARYIEIPREMFTSGDWLTPHINGVPYFEKPPLFYWIQASVMQLFGTGEFAGRISTVCLSTLTCLLVYAIGRMLYGRLSGLLATLVLATSLLGYSLSRVAQLDMPVSFFITACIASFLAAQQTGKHHFYWLMYAASALAVMSKGLIGIAIPGLVIGAWIAQGGHWRILKEARLLSGLLLFLIIAAPWHILISHEHPAFADFYFIHEHVTRYLSDEHKRTEPSWFFIAVIVAGWLPWTGLLPFPLPAKKKLFPKEDIFLWLWIVLPFLFFSASHSKLVPYIFPVFPPMAVLLGHRLAALWEGKLPATHLHRATWLVIALGGALALGLWLIPELPGKVGKQLEALSPFPFLLLLPAAITLAALLWMVLRKHSARRLILAMAAFAAVTDISINYIIARVDPVTIKPLVMTLKQRLRPEDIVVAYDSYWQDLPVYLERTVIVAGWRGEINFGVKHYPETQQWMIGLEPFWDMCAASSQRIYVVMRSGEYALQPMPDDCWLRPITQYGKTVLLEKRIP